ncbi:MAG: DUF481 domain-containing protein [Gammaproteobacteria bacterium]
MMKKILMAFLAGTALLAASAAYAQDDGPWSGKASLGYLATSGNSDSLNVSASAEVGYTTGKWEHTAEASAVGAQQDDETTAEAYLAAWKSHYELTDRDYAFARLRWQKDKFSGYDQQMSETVGYGRKVLDSDRHVLDVEVGLGLRQLDLRDGTSEDGTILRGFADYTFNLSENAEFGQSLLLESGSENTFWESITELKASLIGELALKASYTIRRNSDVPAGSEKTDTFTAIALEYEF